MTLTRQEQARILIRAINLYGVPSQIGMAVEECAELIAAIKRFTRGRIDKEALIDEVADVSIMIDQLGMILGTEAIHQARIEKLKRLEGRIDDEIVPDDMGGVFEIEDPRPQEGGDLQNRDK